MKGESMSDEPSVQDLQKQVNSLTDENTKLKADVEAAKSLTSEANKALQAELDQHKFYAEQAKVDINARVLYNRAGEMVFVPEAQQQQAPADQDKSGDKTDGDTKDVNTKGDVVDQANDVVKDVTKGVGDPSGLDTKPPNDSSTFDGNALQRAIAGGV